MVYIIDDDASVLNAMESLMRLAVFEARAFSSAGEFPERLTFLRS
jgi:FixJ family two-component response regulator